MSIINYLKKSIKKKFTSFTNKLIKEYYMPQQIITGNSGQINTIGNVGDVYPIGAWAGGADTWTYTSDNSTGSQTTMGAGLSLPNIGMHTTIESTPQGISDNVRRLGITDEPEPCDEPIPEPRVGQGSSVGYMRTSLRGLSLEEVSQAYASGRTEACTTPSGRPRERTRINNHIKNGGFINKGRVFNFKH